MMILKCIPLLVLTVFGAVQSASYYGRNIPVEVRYQNIKNIQPSLNEAAENQIRLEKPSNEDQLKAEKIQEAINQVKNEKLSEIQHQLDQEKQKTDLLAAEKLSLESSKLEAAEETGHRIGAQADQKLLEAKKRHSEEINKEVQQDQTQLTADQTKQALRYIPEVQQNDPIEDKPSAATDKLSWLNQAQKYIENGLEELKMNFKPSTGGIVPKPEFWEKLESEVREYFKGEMNKLSLKQQTGGSQQNFFQNLANGFQSVTNNFIQGFQGPNNATGQEDDSSTQQQAPWQGFVGYFQGGVQNLVNTVQNFGQQQSGNGNSTVLGDSGTGSQSPPFFGGIISNVQQFFQGGQNLVGGGNGSQSDSASNGGQNQNFFQGIQQGFNQVVNNFIPTSTPGSAQGDEGSAATPQTGPFQQVFQQFGSIGTAFNQFIGGGQNPPQASEDDSSNAPPQQNFIQSIGQNIGNAFQNVQNQFRPPNIPSIPTGNDSSNPISGIAGQIQQVAGQASGNNPLENLVPGSAGSSSSSKQPQNQTKPEDAPETNEIKEASRSEPIPEEPTKQETIEQKPDEQKKIEEPKTGLKTEPIKEETKIEQITPEEPSKIALKTVPVETKNAVVPDIHIPAVKKLTADESKVVASEVPVVSKVQNIPTMKKLVADESVVFVPETVAVVPAEAQNVDEYIVPDAQNADNIEEIIDTMEAQNTEDKPVDLKKAETMQATE